MKGLSAATLAAVLVLAPVCALAQSSAQPVLPGSLSTSGCPSGVTACYVAYSASNPLPVTTEAPSGTQDTNLKQVNGATVNVGTGAAGTGTQRVTTSTDSTIGTVTAVTAITNALPAGSNIIGKTGIDQTADVTTNGVEIAPTAGSVAGITPSVAGSSASSAVLKASAGNLYSAYVTTGATQGWLMVFNATSLPGNGSTTAGTASGNLQECLYAPANSTTALSFNPGPAEPYSVGITAAFSSTGCGTLTASTTAFIHGSAK